MKPFDAVRLKHDLPDHGLKRGMIGTVLEIFEKPYRAYEVEFADEGGRTIAELALTDADVELADPGS